MPPAKNAPRKSVNRSSTPLMIEEKENEATSNCVRSAGNCSVDRLQTAGQAVVLLGISTAGKPPKNCRDS